MEMTGIQSVEIEGYKGLRSLELDFNSINIVTGRNNTGKTSLLEAIDLVFNPSHLDQYQHHLDGLVNVDPKFEKFWIQSHFDDQTRKIEVGPSEPDRAIQIYNQELSNLISPEHRFYFDQFMNVIPEGQEDEIATILRDVIENAIASLPRDSKQSIANNIYQVNYNGKETHYVHFGRFHRDIGRKIIDSYVDEIQERINEKDVNIEDDISLDDFKEQLSTAIDRTFMYSGSMSYFLDTPENGMGVTFIRSPKLDREPEIDDEDKSAVIKTEIRDYLNDHGLVKGLQDFDFGKLVKESDDGRRQPIDYEFMGDGFKVIVGILWELMAQPESNDVVLIEEPENHMHPGYIDELIPFLIGVAQNEGVQLFITTHNLDFLTGYFDTEIVGKYQEYLENNMKFIQLTDKLTKEIDYDQAEYELEELHTDLRGT